MYPARQFRIIHLIRTPSLYFLIAIGYVLPAQNVVIRGKAHPSYAGRVIQLFTESDYITRQRFKENQDTIEADGFFELHYHTTFTRPVQLKIDNVVARLYTKPDYVYGITIPELDKTQDLNNGAELPVNIGIVGTDSTELNALIFDFQNLYNSVLAGDNTKFVSRAAMFKLADSLQKICDSRYAGVKDTYFKSYVLYSIAAVNASVSRGENYLINGYIVKKPIQYKHYEYMQFFGACFKGYLNTVAAQHKGKTLYNIINTNASYQALNEFIKDDKFLKTDSLKELVLLSNLWEFYFNPEFDRDAIENIVSQLQQKTRITEHKRMAGTMLSFFNNMQPGSAAPDFKAQNRNNKLTGLADFKGKWIYLNFFSTQNPSSLGEMAKIAELKKRYGGKVQFVSVCVDDSLKTYQAYLKAHPRYDWTILFNAGKGLSKTARENYFVTGSEAYFLISNQGYLSQSPAPAPTAGIEYRFNVIFKVRQRTTKTGIR